MSRLALGTVQFGMAYGIANQRGQVTGDDAREMLALAERWGIDTLDTAIAYGHSEATLGAANVQGFKVITKLPAVPQACDSVSKWVQDQVSASLQRLGVQSLYGLLLHRPMQLLQPEGVELHSALNQLKDGGVIDHWGVSIYAPQELESLWGGHTFDIVQAPFSLMDRRLKTSGWLCRLKERGVEIHTRSAFLQGLLLMSAASRPVKFLPWANILQRWDRWLDASGVSPVQACLAFPLAQPEVDRVVVGADGPGHLQEICTFARQSLPIDLPDLECLDERLIDPARWSQL